MNLADLEQTVSSVREAVAALRADDLPEFAVASTLAQLDATLVQTVAATDCILDVCETLDRMAGDLGSLRGRRAREASLRLRDATRRIYEACGFQDITGQRIRRVKGTIKTIETRILSILTALEPLSAVEPSASEIMDGNRKRVPITKILEPRSLDGPQLPPLAMAQSEIDRLLASFG